MAGYTEPAKFASPITKLP